MGSKEIWKLGYKEGFAFIGINDNDKNDKVNEKRSLNE